ncbi:MAG: M1 family metallopeptidase [Anaerolineales bacterium]
MRIALLVTILSFALSACAATSAATEWQGKPTSEGTRSLPPESTSTASPTPPATLQPTPTTLAAGTEAQAEAMLPEFSQDIQVLRDATQYTIDLSVEFDGGSRADLVGQARIQYTNIEQERIKTIPVMLWPNDEQYRARMTVEPALIDGERIEGEALLNGLAVRYRLPQALNPGESVDFTVPFKVEAEGPIGGQTPHRFGISQGVLFAPTFYPLVPRRVDGQWEVEDAPPGGDTTNSLTASFSVGIEAPADLVLVASGTEISRQEIGQERVRVEYVGGPIRDFAFALGGLIGETRTVDEVEVHVWVLPRHEGDLDRVLDAATFQLGLLNELIGPYPYEELDIVDVPGAYGGIEYPGLVTIGTLGGSWVIEPVVHEVAHQWFYGLIGDDQLEEPWMDEAFATYATALYYEHAVGEGRATGYLSDYRDILRNHPNPGRPIGLGVDQYQGSDYSLFVYLKGALFYQELRQRLGEDTFFDFLQSFYQQHRYGFVTAQEFQAAAEMSCSCQLDQLFDRWVFEGGDINLP